MIIVRLLALIFIVVGLMLLGADVVTSLEKGGEVSLRSLAMVLALVQADPSMWIQAALPATASNALLAGLAFPGWAVIGGLGILFAAIATSSRSHREQD
jgi:hypothetical protein